MKILSKALPTMPSLAAMAALWCLVPLQNRAQDYSYETNNGSITITAYLGPPVAQVAVPSSINGLPVTAIGPWAFRSCASLISLNIPNSVADIGDHAFYGCTGLKTLQLSDGTTNITTGAFMHCSSLTELIVPGNVTSIGDCAFASCTALTNATMPASLNTLGSGLFYGCTHLTAITVDPSNPFYSTGNGILFNKDHTTLMEWPGGKSQTCTVPMGVTSIADSAFYDCTTLTNVDIPNSVSNIGRFAFSGCSALQTVRLPENLTTIGPSAFSYCSSLTSVTIPASVTSIGDGTFGSCPSLNAINVEAPNPTYSSLDGVLFDKLQTVLLQYPAARVGDYSIPGTVERLTPIAFAGSYNLTSVTIPDSVTVIPPWTFDLCYQLAKVILPANLRTIDFLAFRDCKALTKVIIPSGVTTINDGAFAGCWNLTAIYFTGEPPTLEKYLFSDVQIATIYYLPGTTGWSNTFAGHPALLWNPKVQTTDPAFGARPPGFCLPIMGTPDIPILLEASTALPGGTWLPVQSCTLTNGSVYLTDPEWNKFPSRFYRIRSP